MPARVRVLLLSGHSWGLDLALGCLRYRVATSVSNGCGWCADRSPLLDEMVSALPSGAKAVGLRVSVPLPCG